MYGTTACRYPIFLHLKSGALGGHSREEFGTNFVYLSREGYLFLSVAPVKSPLI